MNNNNNLKWFWLSFVNDDLPKGQKFLGLCLVQGVDPISAVQRSHDLSINPGGEVMILELNDSEVLTSYQNRFIGKEESILLSEGTFWYTKQKIKEQIT